MAFNISRTRKIAICAVTALLCASCATSATRETEELTPQKRSLLFAQMGTAAMMRGDFPQSIEDLRKAIVADGKNSGAHNNLGLAYLHMGRTEAARGEFQTAINLDNNPDAHINLGILEENQKSYNEARRHYQTAADNLQYKTRHRALTNLAELSIRENKIDEARRILYQSLQANPDYCLSHFLLGSILARENNAHAAAEEYKKSVRSSCADNVEAHYRLGLQYLKLKKYDNARSEFAFLIERHPESLQAQRAAEELKLIP